MYWSEKQPNRKRINLGGGQKVKTWSLFCYLKWPSCLFLSLSFSLSPPRYLPSLRPNKYAIFFRHTNQPFLHFRRGSFLWLPNGSFAANTVRVQRILPIKRTDIFSQPQSMSTNKYGFIFESVRVENIFNCIAYRKTQIRALSPNSSYCLIPW